MNLRLQSGGGELRGGINSQRASQAMPGSQCQPQGNPPRVRSRLSYPLKIRSSALRAKCMVQRVKNLMWIQLAFANEDASGGAGF